MAVSEISALLRSFRVASEDVDLECFPTSMNSRDNHTVLVRSPAQGVESCGVEVHTTVTTLSTTSPGSDFQHNTAGSAPGGQPASEDAAEPWTPLPWRVPRGCAPAAPSRPPSTHGQASGCADPGSTAPGPRPSSPPPPPGAAA
nr:translation initiation factor IF-2-like [Peromyscus maniculatus bairdii]